MANVTRHFLGFVLVATAFVMGCWIFASVIRLARDPSGLKTYVQALSQDMTIPLGQQGDGAPLQIPREVIAGFVVGGFHVIGCMVTASFLSAGVNLLNLDALRIARRLDRLREYLAGSFQALRQQLHK